MRVSGCGVMQFDACGARASAMVSRCDACCVERHQCGEIALLRRQHAGVVSSAAQVATIVADAEARAARRRFPNRLAAPRFPTPDPYVLHVHVQQRDRREE